MGETSPAIIAKPFSPFRKALATSFVPRLIDLTWYVLSGEFNLQTTYFDILIYGPGYATTIFDIASLAKISIDDKHGHIM